MINNVFIKSKIYSSKSLKNVKKYIKRQMMYYSNKFTIYKISKQNSIKQKHDIRSSIQKYPFIESKKYKIT